MRISVGKKHKTFLDGKISLNIVRDRNRKEGKKGKLNIFFFLFLFISVIEI